MFTPARVVQHELLDEHDAPQADVHRSLRDLRRINRYLGGLRIYRKLIQRAGAVRSVVDIGAGSADSVSQLPDGVLRIALDFKIDHLAYQRDERVSRVAGDAARLPFRTASVDVITSAHFFHHFTAEENAEMLGESLRVAHKAVIVNDTRRHYVPYLFVRLLALLRLVGRITRFDAPASVLRGYTTSEARVVAERTTASRVEAFNVWPFRFGLILWK